MAMKVAVIGGGSWGTAVASIACRNANTVLWARRPEVAKQITTDHVNEYLPDIALPDDLAATADLEEALDGAGVVVMAVPSHGFRDVLIQGAPSIAGGVPVVSLSKGVEQQTLKRMTEIVGDVLPDHPAGVLTGPNLAKEVMAGHPAASVVAMADDEIARQLQELFAIESFRVYTNPDVVGCEVAGALKNVMAIAAGMADGMGFGDNTKAALMTRGLAELTRLGIALGGQPLTFSGLAGMGDLVATCMSRQSRNRHVGEQLGQGRKLDEIIAEMNMVAEGVKTCKPILELGRTVDAWMPITEGVVAVIYEGHTAQEMVSEILARPAVPETFGIEA